MRTLLAKQVTSLGDFILFVEGPDMLGRFRIKTGRTVSGKYVVCLGDSLCSIVIYEKSWKSLYRIGHSYPYYQPNELDACRIDL